MAKLKTLRKGDEGSEVADLQHVLAGMGYRITADGDFGPRTLRTVKAAQKKLGLRPDGIVGRKTYAALDEAYQPDVKNFQPSANITNREVSALAKRKKTSKVSDHKHLKGVHPKVAELAVELVALAAANGQRIIITSGHRSFKAQAAIYAQGRTKPGKIVSKAKPGFSRHNYGTAFDICCLDKRGKADWSAAPYDRVAKLSRQIPGLQSGAFWRWKDRPHYELAGLPSTKKMLATYKAAGSGQRGIKAVWKRYVD